MSGPSEEEKTNTGYTYWKRQIPDAHVLPSCEPKKIEHSSSEESLVGRSSSDGANLISRWNAGTTYEEKNVTDRAKRILMSLISEISHGNIRFQPNGPEADFCKGEVHAHVVRGKVKIGYELSEMRISMKGKDGSGCGSIDVEDLDSTDPTGFTLTVVGGKGDILKSEARALAVKLMEDLCNKLLSE